MDMDEPHARFSADMVKSNTTNVKDERKEEIGSTNSAPMVGTVFPRSHRVHEETFVPLPLHHHSATVHRYQWGETDYEERRSLTSDEGRSQSPSIPSALKGPMRKGKWTPEEEAYTWKIIQDFNRGFLPLGAGTTLRAYLSSKLNCDPMRITKKFAGGACIGKRVFQPCEKNPENLELMRRSQEILTNLEAQFHARLEQTKPLKKTRIDSRRESLQQQAPDVRWNSALCDPVTGRIQRRCKSEDTLQSMIHQQNKLQEKLSYKRYREKAPEFQQDFEKLTVEAASIERDHPPTTTRNSLRTTPLAPASIRTPTSAPTMATENEEDNNDDRDNREEKKTSAKTSKDVIERYSQSDTDACGLLLDFFNSVQSRVAKYNAEGVDHDGFSTAYDGSTFASYRPLKRTKSVTSFV